MVALGGTLTVTNETGARIRSNREVTGFGMRFLREVSGSPNAPVLVLAWAFAAVGYAVVGPPPGPLRWLLMPIVYVTAFYALSTFAWHAFRPGGVGRLLEAQAWREYAGRYGSRDRLMSVILLSSLFGPVIGTFMRFRSALSELSPFRMDPAFAALDRALHFGVDPWRLTTWMPPLGTVAIDRFYFIGWGGACALVFGAYCCSKASSNRLQYLLAATLTFIVPGTVLAISFSSVGPILYDRITGEPHFLPHIEHLAATSDWLATLEQRKNLWLAYELGVWTPGITAMPSMHVANALVAWLGVRKLHRYGGYAGGLLFAVTLFGSVHLGWHYAIDGYASVISVVVIWWGSGRFARWWLQLGHQVPGYRQAFPRDHTRHALLTGHDVNRRTQRYLARPEAVGATVDDVHAALATMQRL